MTRSTESAFFYLTKLQRAIKLMSWALEHDDLHRAELILTLLQWVETYLARRFTEEAEADREGS